MIYFAIACNLLLFGLEAYTCIWEFVKHKYKNFQYYTYDSNVLGCVAGGLMAGYLIRSLFCQDNAGAMLPLWVRSVKLTATAALTLTFLVVIFVLAPAEGEHGYRKALLVGPLKFQHLICPLLAIASFLFADPKGGCSFKSKLVAMLVALAVTIVYATIVVILNIKKVLKGPYPFLYVYEQPVFVSILWAIVIIFGDLLIIAGYALLRGI